MKIFTLALAASLLLSACNNKPASKKETTKNDTIVTTPPTDTSSVPMTGNDRDEHGCISSAGYTWSVLKKDCIRLFDAGIRLTAADAVADKTTSAFVVFSEDHKKAELYIPHQPGTGIILEQTNNTLWSGDTWTLEKTAKGLMLKNEGVVQYSE